MVGANTSGINLVVNYDLTDVLPDYNLAGNPPDQGEALPGIF